MAQSMCSLIAAETANGIKLILRLLPSGISDKFNLKMMIQNNAIR
ncbi:hypothetical protein AB0Y04_01650 [Loigolactobacillus coryniformis]